MNDPRLARLAHLIREQDEQHERRTARHEREVAALRATGADTTTISDRDRHRLKLLDWLNERCPNNVVSEHGVE